MPTPDKDLMTRLTELVSDNGHQWKKIAPILETEGYRDRKGNPYSENYLRKRIKNQKAAGSGKGSKPSEGGKRSERSAIDIQDLARAVISLLMQDGLLDSSVKEVLGHLECTPFGQAHEMPPQPERVTDRRWVKLAGTCDCELVKLFHERRRELRLSVSQMLDFVLWNFFGRPRLSFQSKASELSEE
ncbi:MAG: hypothetical protein WBG50_22810 [Desulfomonilaceae bacterium]